MNLRHITEQAFDAYLSLGLTPLSFQWQWDSQSESWNKRPAPGIRWRDFSPRHDWSESQRERWSELNPKSKLLNPGFADMALLMGEQPNLDTFLVAIDFDRKNHDAEGNVIDGKANLVAWLERHPTLPQWDKISPFAFMALETPNNGEIWVFTVDPADSWNLGNPTNALVPGVDIRADGGLIMTVPSQRPEHKTRPMELPAKPYSWIIEPSISDSCVECGDFPSIHYLPSEFVTEIANWTAKSVPESPASADMQPIRQPKARLRSSTVEQGYGCKARQSATEAIVDQLWSSSPGSRNRDLNRAAYSLGGLRDGLSTSVYEAKFLELADAALSIGLSQLEIGPTIHSGRKSGEGRQYQSCTCMACLKTRRISKFKKRQASKRLI